MIDGTNPAADDGHVEVTYSNSTGALKLEPGNLHVYNVSGCYGLFHNGDPVTLADTLTLSPKQTISSP